MMENGPAGDTPAQPISNSSILGEITWLLTHSSLHSDWSIGAIPQWVFPALLHNQFRVYRKNGKPCGYVSWAWMSKDVEQAYVLNTGSLQPVDWKSGDRFWIIDFLAPFGYAKEIAHDLKYGVFANTVGRYLRVKPGSDTMQIRYMHGAKAIKQASDRERNPTVELQKLD